MHAFARVLVQARKALLALAVLLSALLAIGIPRTGFDTSLSVLLTRSDPWLAERDRMQAEFPGVLEISFAFEPASGDVFTHATLAAMVDLSQEYRQIPLARSMNSILAWQSPYGDDTFFEKPLAQIGTYTVAELQERRARALTEEFVAGLLLAPAGDLTLASVRLGSATLTAEQRLATAEATLALRDSLQARHPEVAIHVSSEALYELSSRDAMLDDLFYLLPIVLLLCNGIICYSFRSVLLGASILLVSMLTIAMTVGILGWVGVSFNTISVMAPLVVVTIAVANSVHLVSIYRQRRLAGMAPAEAMVQSLRYNLRPISLATLTTIAGFASLNLASSPAISSFGSVVALGVAIAWALTLLVLPGVVLLLPVDVGTRTAQQPLLARITAGCRRVVVAHGTLILWTVALLALLALPLSLRNTTDFDRASFVNEDSVLHDYVTAVSTRMARGPQLVYGIDARTPDGVVEPEFLRRVDEFAQWLRQQDGVLQVASLVELVKGVNVVTNDNQPGFAVIPDDVAVIEDHLFNYQMVQVSSFTLDNFVNADFSLLRLFVGTGELSNQETLDLNEHIGAEFARRLPEYGLLHGSSTLVFARMNEAVTLELLRSYALSLLLITVALIIGMRSLSYGLLSMLPNLLPAVFVFGAWGLLVGSIDPFVMMLFSISIGLVVDDTVHILSSYQSCRAEGLTPRAAVDISLERAGPALIITTAVLALGTCVLMAASTLYFQQAATLLVPIVVVALVLDLLFFPALLMRLDRAVAR
jgi:predicted RND superfamily exporter protein